MISEINWKNWWKSREWICYGHLESEVLPAIHPPLPVICVWYWLFQYSVIGDSRSCHECVILTLSVQCYWWFRVLSWVWYKLFQYSVIGDSGSCHECVILTLSVQCYWWFRVLSWVCDIDSFSTALLVILGPVLSVWYWIFQYSVIRDSGSCHECVILTLSVQRYWWFWVLSWVCHIESFSTVLFVIPGPVLSVWYKLFQYSVIGDSGSCHECVILTLSEQCYWWFRVLSWVCDIDSFSTALLVILGPVMSLSYWIFQYSVIGDSGSCHDCVILTLSVQCYWWFRVVSWVCHIDSFSTVLLVIQGPVMSVWYCLFQYSVIGDSGSCRECVILTLSVQCYWWFWVLSLVCHIDSFSTVLLEFRVVSWVCDIDSFSTVLLVIQVPVMSVWYCLFQYSVIGDSGSCLESVILTLSVQCYWWFRVLSWVCHIDSFSTVLLVIPGPVMSVSYWLFQYSVIGDSGSCHECVILTLSVQCYWWFRVLSWVCHIDSFSTVLLVIPGRVLSVSYWLFQYSVISDSGSCHECVILTLSVQCYWWFRVLSWVCYIDYFSTLLLVIPGRVMSVSYDSFSTVLLVIPGPVMSVWYWLFQYIVIGDSGSCLECVILTLSVQCYWWFRVMSWVCHIDFFITVLLVIPGRVLSVSYWLFHYSVIGDSGSCHECVMLTLSVQCYWWFRVVSWVCDIDSFSTVLLVMPGRVLSVWYWLFQYSVIGDSGPCHECAILTLSVQCYWWFRVLSWVCHIDSFSTVLLVIPGPVMGVSYWLFQYSVIGDSGSCHECVILTLSVHCYWWFRVLSWVCDINSFSTVLLVIPGPIMSVSYWLFQYSVIGDSGSCLECVILTLSVQCYWWFRVLSWVCHIDSFSTVLLVIQGPVMSVSYWLFQYSVIGNFGSSHECVILTLSVQCYWWLRVLSWVCHIDFFSTVLLVISGPVMSVSYWLFQYSVIGDSGSCHESVILTLSVQCYWWYQVLSWVCDIDSFSTVLLMIPGRVLSVSYWLFQYSVIGDSGSCHESVILTLSVQCYWWFRVLSWVCHIDSFSTVLLVIPGRVMRVWYWLFQYSVIGDSGSYHECVILTLSVQCYWWFWVLSWVCHIDSFSTVLLVIPGPVTSVSYWLFQYSVIGDSGSYHECVILTLSVQCYWWFRVLSWVCHIDFFSTVLLVIPGPVMSVSYWLFQYSVIGDSGSCHECVILTLSVQCYWWFRVLSWVCHIDSFSTVLLVIPGRVLSVSYWLFQYSVISDSGSCHECVILTLSVQCYWWFRVLSWVCYIDYFSTLLLVIPGRVMSVSYWLFQYSVIGDSRSCHECVILTLSVHCYWWFRVLSWVCHIDSFSTVLLVIQGPVMSVSYWLFQYSVIGDSGSCHECVILTFSV